MRLQLNNISDSIASENLAHALDRLDANLREVARGLRPVHPDIWFAIGLRSLDVGLLSFRQQAPAAQVQMYLAQAGQYLLRYFAECPMPTVGEDRNPWQFEQVINLVVSFCERINRSAVAAIPRAQYDTRDNRDA